MPGVREEPVTAGRSEAPPAAGDGLCALALREAAWARDRCGRRLARRRRRRGAEGGADERPDGDGRDACATSEASLGVNGAVRSVWQRKGCCVVCL